MESGLDATLESLRSFHKLISERKPQEYEFSTIVSEWCQQNALTPYGFVNENLCSWVINLDEESGYLPFEDSTAYRLFSTSPEQLFQVISASSDKYSGDWKELLGSLSASSFKPILVAFALQLASE